MSHCLSLSEPDFLSWPTFGEGDDSLSVWLVTLSPREVRGRTHVFSANLPPRLLFVHPLSERITLISKPDNDVTLDRSQRTNPRGARGIGHRTDRDVERRAGWCLTVISQLAVVEVSLEDDQVGF